MYLKSVARFQVLKQIESWLKRVRPVVEEKEKEIPIYLRVTKTIKLNVKESDSIGHVKALLHDKEGIPVCLQQLLSGDDKLADGRKLVDYGICENSTLHAYVEDSVPVITLYVKRSYAEGIVTVISKICSTIHDMKYRILVKEGTDSGKFSLFHDGKLLEDGKTLAFLNIDDGSTLHMVRNPGDRAGYAIGDKPLFMGKHKLEDEKQLYYYDIKEGSVLLAVEGTMQIFIIKRTDVEWIMLDVHKHNSVKEVKELVLDKLGIPVHLQKLTFEGKGLFDSLALSGYEIWNESILYLDVHNCTENRTHSTPQTGLLRDDTQPQ
ncbi:hypothetical protein CQW23_09294 [Capsicum baccatum]|uniref:Ubiquitin-like domain-containing protein n=1 Tax=Capsicum baccatum TaxID=33114 RepID=A0A2G2WWD6_CAPBA|nr:hypothetical protein CQW23_09294 [Capsicum baccatum]